MTKKTNKEFYVAQLTDRASECEIRAHGFPFLAWKSEFNDKGLPWCFDSVLYQQERTL